ncbi:sigma-E factor negative regulatory protein [Cognatiluteimonas weifangensis]|uniref:Anti sigma-E protein RseA N-terminal domain-containing protein n=1 Tax=Cognatiluteimonas weifangensis TaxID=2303539 RepID=A0A372DKA8_9GAMM|nr:sigma-E factor negative regulatory protein [Luteimonas weifangensis]RFP59980.1 hypothetical protein D0Y53_09570 [Luteimonas weifangensis]
MTSGNDFHDKILDHNRLQLSALLDGELAPDEARFLLRRLQHDTDLAGCWSRWQLAGDILRGRDALAAPAGFAGGVSAAIAAQAAPAPVAAHPPRKLRWGSGAALAAASVAVFALFVSRQAPDASVPEGAAGMEIASVAPASVPAPAPVPAPRPAPAAPQAPDSSARLAAAVAVAEVPRRAVARRSRAQSQHAASTRAARAAEPQRAIAAAPPPAVNPFAPQASDIAIRPWPRALLPGASGGAFNVDYGSMQATSAAFYPFQPRPMTPPQPADDAGSAH